MEDRQFDVLAKRVGASRRSLLKKMVGVGGAAAIGLLGVEKTEAARRGYGGPPNLAGSRVGTLTITWDYAGGQSCTAYATLAGWDANTTYTVEYSFTTPFGPRGGSQRLTTDANGAAYGRILSFIRSSLVTFSVNGVIVQGYPDC